MKCDKCAKDIENYMDNMVIVKISHIGSTEKMCKHYFMCKKCVHKLKGDK